MSASIQSFLTESKILLRHAINLQDFKAYCDSGAVLSRKLLEEKGRMTPFYSDGTDKERNVWDRVFGNFDDNGRLFWKFDGCPNAYGPITITISPEVWAQTEDIAVCDKNAASKGFELSKERFELNRLQDCFNVYGDLKTYGLEISLGVESVPFRFIQEIVVEPIEGLLEAVQAATQEAGLNVNPTIRDTATGRGSRSTYKAIDKAQGERFDEFIAWAREHKGDPPNVEDLVPADSLSEWFDKLTQKSRNAFRQWLEYTYVGTLAPLNGDTE